MRVFGRVEFVGHDARQARFARIVPLFEVGDGRARAVEVGEFPSEHMVFLPSPKDVKRGDLLFFTPESHPGTRDEFWAGAIEPATELLDLRAYGSIDGVRRTIAMGTLARGSAPDRVALWCSEHELLGPLKLKDDATVISFDATQLGRVPCHNVSKVRVHALPDDGGRVRHILATSSLGAPTMYVDWSDDEAVVRRALRFVVEKAREQGPEPAVTDRLIALSAKYAAGMGETAELRLKQYQLSRARELLLESQALRALARTFATEILAHPMVEKELASERASTRELMQSELRSELAVETERVSAARSEHASLVAQVASAGAELQASRDALEKQLSEVDVELSTRLHSILERPASMLADVAVLRAGLSLNGSWAQRTAEAPAALALGAVKPRSTVEWTRANRQLTELAQLRQALNASFKARGVSPSCAMALHCALVAGLVPVVTGECQSSCRFL